MIKIESPTLEAAYTDAAAALKCSVTELKIEVVQVPSKGVFGLFKKNAIIVAAKMIKEVETPTLQKEVVKSEKPIESPKKEPQKVEVQEETNEENKKIQKVQIEEIKQEKVEVKAPAKIQKERAKKQTHVPKQNASLTILNDTIMPTSFVSMQEDEEYDDVSSYLADYDDEEDNDVKENISDIAVIIEEEINTLFDLTCFNIDKVEVSVYDENKLLIEFKGEDAALLIGKEGYRYKALSYMIFNWVNTKYQVQLRLEIAEFLKNQEEAVLRYLVNVCENVDRDGKAQTKILDGVLVQIALRELRDKYPNKYVVIRSTRDGLKYIIVNDYHTN
ncbi:MAG: Jag N-terminal domain-containing protein [Campylobacterales bacterium]|nr:Jag N-terminal domain-containing protein [Campylobacterales bacterium]